MAQAQGHLVWERPEVSAVFRCQRCGECCRGGEAGMEIRPEEGKAIASHLGLALEEFAGRFCLGGGGRLRLRRNAGSGMCSLWEDGNCLAWEFKPRACSLWPFPAHLLDDVEAVRASCPGLKPEATPEALSQALRLVQEAFPK